MLQTEMLVWYRSGVAARYIRGRALIMRHTKRGVHYFMRARQAATLLVLFTASAGLVPVLAVIMIACTLA
jgi:hypothetical protein